jgi:2-C-methyl-D-erythritol 4-phosphate cytidylyltransferase
VLVVPDAREWEGAEVAALTTGGATRAESVRAGLAAVPATAEIVVVHDAARPLATVDLFGAVIGAVRGGADGAVPGLALADTLKRVEDVRVTATVDRVGLVTVQTPQAFDAATLRAAHASGGDATDDAALVEAIGGTVVVVPGDPRNLKVTGPADLMIAAALLAVS